MIYPKDFINKVVLGDCLSVLPDIPDEVIDLIYLDPPFGDNSIDAPYGLKWKDKAHYISWMRERLVECKRVLKNTGSIYLHCDWHSNAHLRLMMDDIFGINNFQNEIIWCFRTWSSKQDRFQRKHQTVYFYTKGNKHTFNQKYEPVSEITKQVWGLNKQKVMFDENGKRYSIVTEEISRGTPMHDWWVISSCIGGFMLKSENKLFDDCSTYKGQKPIKLLKRIIEVSSNPGDIVLDPMCGSGTTLQAAYKLNRKFIGIDRIKNTVQISNKRLEFDLKQGRID